MTRSEEIFNTQQSTFNFQVGSVKIKR